MRKAKPEYSFHPLTLCLTVFLLSSNAFAQPRTAGLEVFTDSLAEEYVGSTLAGLSIGVTRGDEVLLKKSYGYANLEWQVPMPMDAVHEVGSLTKQFTSVAVLQLAEQGLVNLDADIGEYLPDFDTQGRRVSVRRLMDHTSGIQGITEIPEFFELSTQAGERTEVFRMLEEYPFEFEPGFAQIYNNSAYMLLGHIIERVSGQGYAEYLEENVYPLAGLENTTYCSNTEIVRNKATGYQYTPDGFQMARYHDHTWPYSAGSLCSTVSDILSWNHALHQGEVLSQDMYEVLITPLTLADGWPLRYAMGVGHYMHTTGRVIEHSGGIDGFLSFARYYPDDDVTVVVLQNALAPPGPGAITDQIGEHLFGTRHELEPASFTGPLSRYTGEYRGAVRGGELVIRVEINEGELEAIPIMQGNQGQPQSLNFLENDTFFNNLTYFYFEISADGERNILRVASPGSHYVLEQN
ncbi:MAG: hypothetical protein CMP91_08685 [Gammaproteobacteria bacterium]|nr:hypothetical protein [Gammaproteobacteria bacterium]|tara:strand:+ start:1698 stop:3092 length:1395 start_codon:yes stop_codon:yes gene_type:complete